MHPDIVKGLKPMPNALFDESKPISAYFGENTFGLGQMREKLHRDAYQALLRTLEQGKKLPKEAADAIANVIREWAVSRGATHYCHWFQPMTGLTAEKHDAFIAIQHAHHSELRVLERFTGSQLLQGEPDASSFPSGGMRSTFEARGYTAWDPSSPLFLMGGDLSGRGPRGKTLCIPSVFFGYHGEALDHKTPLLRSLEALSKEACEFLKLLGDVDVKHVSATLGPEQEYFLIDKELAKERPDLVLCGRTLLGGPSPRGQQLEDHYFGSIPSRVLAFMEDLERELYKLGVPIKTRHNEVAPSQFELAPIFEAANIAVDHNTLTMELLKRIAGRHGFLALLHEKPFAGINGNGKHCNWSLSNDKGENLLDPGTTPHQNLRFLAVVAVILKAVHRYSAALRASIASSGNDHRLGGNEAPPAILSVFLGSLLDNIFQAIERGEAAQGTEAQIIHLGVSHIPDISRDYTDRNRTSPFAFTGNKFEFRAVGGSANTAVPVTILNAAVAAAFAEASARLRPLLGQKKSRDEAVMELVRALATESKPIRFEGNNYSEEWKAEAKRRGLPILPNTPSALAVWGDKKEIGFLVEQKVLTEAEVASRHHVYVERYVKQLAIEQRTLVELVHDFVVPATEQQLAELATVASALHQAEAKTQHKARADRLEKAYATILKLNGELEALLEKVEHEPNETKKMALLADSGIPIADELRSACDIAEKLVADRLWPLPKYRELLFSHTLG
jgi:glutamine synthetase